MARLGATWAHVRCTNISGSTCARMALFGAEKAKNSSATQKRYWDTASSAKVPVGPHRRIEKGLRSRYLLDLIDLASAFMRDLLLLRLTA